MVVRPVVAGTAHDSRFVPREVFVHRVHGISGERRGMLAELLEDEEVFWRQLGVGKIAARSQHEPAGRVKRVVSAHVGSSLHRAHERQDLRLAHRVIPGAEHVHTPAGREVAVQVETCRIARLVDGESVIVFDQAFGEQSVPLLAGWCAERADGNHHARLFGMLHPSPVDVGDAHGENATVTVDVLRVETRPAVAVAPRPRAHARAVKERTVGQRILDTVGVHARSDVEGASSQRFDHRRVTSDVLRDEVMHDVERGDTASDFDGMDVRVDPVRGLRVMLAGS